MHISTDQLFYFFEVVIFIAVILMNLMKKNGDLVKLYVVQSWAVVALLAIDSWVRGSLEMGVVAFVVLVVKGFFAPYFFTRFVRKNNLNVQTSTYLSVPMTMVALLLIISFAHSDVFQPITTLINSSSPLATMLISSIFMSVFMLINRKGSLSQIIGILSVENAIVAIGFFFGLIQTIAIEMGILFDIIVWIVLAMVFLQLLYEQLGASDVSRLNQLRK